MLLFDTFWGINNMTLSYNFLEGFILYNKLFGYCTFAMGNVYIEQLYVSLVYYNYNEMF